MATEFTITGVTVSGAFPEAFTYSGLSAPIAGTLPTFSSAPVVFIRNRSTKRDLFVDSDSITTSGFNIDAGDIFDENPPYTVSLGIITTDVTAAGASVATAVNFPYYCSLQDVKDVIQELDRSFGTNTSTNNLYNSRLRRYISLASARLNGTLAKASYQTPGTNSTKQTFSSSLTASQNVVTINQVQDGTSFSAGDTVRLHGTSSNVYNDEFTNVVAVSGDVVDVEFLENSYDADGTIEIVTDGMNILRFISAQGAAWLSLGGLTLGFATSENSRTAELGDIFNADLRAIEQGHMRFPDLTKNLMNTYVQKETDDLFNDGDPTFTDGMVF